MDTLECFPAGCATCHHRTASGGCELMHTLEDNDVITLNEGSGRRRVEHPIGSFTARYATPATPG